VLSISGIILLAISALNVILSVSESPNCKLPSAVIVPVACKLPITSVLPFKFIFPVPEVVKFKSALEFTVAI